MKFSARNQLEGTIIAIAKGATTVHVRLDVGGAIVTSAITNVAVRPGGSSYPASTFGSHSTISG